MKRILFLLLAVPAFAQSPVIGGSVQYVTTAPSGACVASPPVKVLFSTGVIYTCDNGTWAASGGGGGPTFAYPTGTGIVRVAGGSAWGTTAELSGDITTSGSNATTLATVNSGSGACGDGTHVCAVTTNAKGLVTSQTATAITSAGNYVNLCALVTLTNATCSNGLITGGTTPAAITISAIPGTYLNLDVDFVGTGSIAGFSQMAVTLNADTTSGHYIWIRSGGLTNGVATVAGSVNLSSSTSFTGICFVGGTNQPGGGCHLHLPMYAQGGQKVIHSQDWWGDAAANGGGGSAEGEWTQTSAITSITFTPVSGTIATGALLSIHGIN